PGIQAVVADGGPQLLERLLAGAGLAFPQEQGAEAARAVQGDRDDALAGQVATHDQRVDAVEATGAEELPPALLRAVNVRRVIERERRLRGLGGTSQTLQH